MSEKEDVLPQGWIMCTLADVVDVRKHSIDPCEYPDTMFNYLSIGNVESETGNIVSFTGTLGKNIRSPKLITKEDVLYSKLRPNLNKVSLPDFDGISASDLIPLTPKEGIERKYLGYFLRRQQTVQYACDRIMGIQLPRISIKDLLAIPFPLAPSKEQRRIVNAIEASFAETKTVRDSLNLVSTSLQFFRNSILVLAFKGKLCPQIETDISAQVTLEQIKKVYFKNGRKAIFEGEEKKSTPHIDNALSSPLPSTWVWTKIGDVFEVSSGRTPNRNQPEFWKGTIPWVKSSEVAFKDIIRTQECITEAGLKKSNAKIHPPGTVLLALYGDGKTRGQAAILRISAATNQAIASILCAKTEFPSEYIYWWLRYRYAETRKIGVGINQKNMYLYNVVNMPFPLAPLNEQKRVVEKIDKFFELANKVEDTVALTLRKTVFVNRVILQKAFSGKLSHQDPVDEPATILFSRLKTLKPIVKKKAEKPLGKIAQISSYKILDILNTLHSATVEEVLKESGLSIPVFWDELEKEIAAGRIEETRKGGLIYLKARQ